MPFFSPINIAQSVGVFVFILWITLNALVYDVKCPLRKLLTHKVVKNNKILFRNSPYSVYDDIADNTAYATASVAVCEILTCT